MSTSRRDLFKLGAAAAAAAAVLSPKEAAAQRIVRPHTTRPKAPPATGDSLLRLVRRVTNGVTEEEYTRAKSLGFKRYLEYQLNYTAIDDSAVDAFVTRTYPSLSQVGDQLYQQDQNLLFNQLVDATVYRGAFSKRQLYERMVAFWTDHFNIYYPKVQYLKILDDREVVRKHALGNFQDMLRASAHSPAMLEYLDNTRSSSRSVNQNYAREIMELHTLGVDGGYTQTDVEEVTKILTGWTIQGRGLFRFDPARHDFTAKTVLGVSYPAMTPGSAAGVEEGERLLDQLVNHPSTAHFIATKMTRWLLQYDPPKAVVDKVAATYTRTKGDIKSMVRDILTPANLLAAPLKYKQPRHLVQSALRATEPTVTSVNVVSAQLSRVLGMPLFQWEDPDGWPDNVDWWAGLVLQRWNFASFITGLASGAIVVDVNPLMATGAPAAVTEAISKRAFGGEMSTDLKTRLTAFLSAAPVNTGRVREAFALALSSTEFQWY